MDLQEIQNELESIKERNERVELDKAWETSRMRKVVILLFTYVLLSLYMHIIGVQDPFINAVVPTLGFWLSTLSLPWIKKLWVEYKRKTKK